MKNERGITLIKLIIIIVLVVIAIFIVVSNLGKSKVNLQWGAMPSTEYYELKLAAITSEASNGTGTLSLESFNTLGRDVKDAGGKWFKDSNVNFKASVFESGGVEIITLTDGKHTASFTSMQSLDYVIYTFTNEDHTGYKITIE
jgi:type II secretory pathway pseudopilin PulG